MYKNIKLNDNLKDGLLLEMSPKKILTIGQEEDLLNINNVDNLLSSLIR